MNIKLFGELVWKNWLNFYKISIDILQNQSFIDLRCKRFLCPQKCDLLLQNTHKMRNIEKHISMII